MGLDPCFFGTYQIILAVAIHAPPSRKVQHHLLLLETVFGLGTEMAAQFLSWSLVPFQIHHPLKVHMPGGGPDESHAALNSALPHGVPFFCSDCGGT